MVLAICDIHDTSDLVWVRSMYLTFSCSFVIYVNKKIKYQRHGAQTNVIPNAFTFLFKEYYLQSARVYTYSYLTYFLPNSKR